MEDIKTKTKRRSKFTLKSLTQGLAEKILNSFDPHADPKTALIKASDFINATKLIIEANGLKVVPDNTFKGEQDIDLE